MFGNIIKGFVLCALFFILIIWLFGVIGIDVMSGENVALGMVASVSYLWVTYKTIKYLIQ